MTEPAQLPGNINDLEKQSYKADSEGNTALRVSDALVNRAGVEAKIDALGSRLSTYDINVNSTLAMMLDVLKDIDFKLGVIIDG